MSMAISFRSRCAAWTFLTCSGLLLAACESGDDDAASDAGTDPAVDSSTPLGRELTPISAPVPDECITDVSPGEHSFACEPLEFDCAPEGPGGIPVGCFHVTVPEQCVEGACGVILNVHGIQMNGQLQDELTNMSELAREHSYIVIHPTAHMGPNPLPGADIMPSWRAGVDDPKLYDFVQRVIAAFHADTDRIHVTGFSQGGAMSWRMLCAYSELFVSVAPGAAGSGALGAGSAPSDGICAGDSPMPDPARPIMFLHGRDDGLSPHSVAQATAGRIIEGWGLDSDEVVSEDHLHLWTRHTNDSGGLFEFVEYDYASTVSLLRGHCFPGTTAGGTLACRMPFGEPQAFHWGEAVMDFFLAHPKR